MPLPYSKLTVSTVGNRIQSTFLVYCQQLNSAKEAVVQFMNDQLIVKRGILAARFFETKAIRPHRGILKFLIIATALCPRNHSPLSSISLYVVSNIGLDKI